MPDGARARIRRELVRPGFRRRCAALQGQQKIIYALTPPPNLANIGDHAQAVAIHRWFRTYFSDWPVIEVDKNESLHFVEDLARVVGPEDVVFLHSGGNLGDRGMWSERARRTLIARFQANPIISLPQTIYFSDTETGRAECERTKAIYAAHPRLTIIGRDAISAGLAAELFPRAATFAVPDFVLSLPPRASVPSQCPPRVLLCIRNDNESILNSEKRQRLIASIGGQPTVIDTEHSGPIPTGERETILNKLLSCFAAHDVVVTDRYHGAIFSVISGKPTIVLPTVDHKLTSAIDWFAQFENVKMVDDIGKVAPAIIDLLRANQQAPFDWNQMHFEPLAKRLRAEFFPHG